MGAAKRLGRGLATADHGGRLEGFVDVLAGDAESVLERTDPVSRGEVVRLQLILPFVAFVIFSQLPAGKKLFVITTLAFSLLMMLALAASKKFSEIREKLEILSLDRIDRK